jgi:hypothetical protein
MNQCDAAVRAHAQITTISDIDAAEDLMPVFFAR